MFAFTFFNSPQKFGLIFIDDPGAVFIAEQNIVPAVGAAEQTIAGLQWKGPDL